MRPKPCTALRSEFQDERIIVFVNTKRNADTVSQLLHEKGYSSTVLHSGKSQVRAPPLARF